MHTASMALRSLARSPPRPCVRAQRATCPNTLSNCNLGMQVSLPLGHSSVAVEQQRNKQYLPQRHCPGQTGKTPLLDTPPADAEDEARVEPESLGPQVSPADGIV